MSERPSGAAKRTNVLAILPENPLVRAVPPGAAGTRLRPGKGVVLACLLLAVVALVCRPASAQTKECLAYLHNENVLARCGHGPVEILAHKKGLTGFAISGARIALMTGASPVAKIELLSPAGRTNVVLPHPDDVQEVYASCGTLLATSWRVSFKMYPTWDLLTGRPVAFTTAFHPVCTADRRVIAGTSTFAAVIPKSPPGPTLFPPEDSVLYGLSPSGRYLAYMDGIQVCVRRIGSGKSVCFDMAGGGSPSTTLLSVNDAGQVLYENESGGGCYFSGRWSQNQNPKPPGALDACIGVFVAGPDSSPKLLVPRGTDPVWVPESSVKAILAIRAAHKDLN